MSDIPGTTITNTNLAGLEAAKNACHRVRERFMRDRREAMVEKNHRAQTYATAQALAVFMCIEEMQRSIKNIK